MFSHPYSPTAHRGGGQQGEEVTVKQAIAASATTLQQCALPGSSAQPGGDRGSAGSLGERSHHSCLRSGAEGLRCPGHRQCPGAMPSGWHRSSACLLGCPDQPQSQPGSSLLLTVVCGLLAMALSQSLIPAYPPLTSF